LIRVFTTEAHSAGEVVRVAAMPLASEDLDHILSETAHIWEELRNQRLFITGGTGFFGCWLLESFCWANRNLNLGAQATVLTRDPDAFAAKVPHLASDDAITLHPGDVRSFLFPEGEFPFIIHAATDVSTSLALERPLEMLDTIVGGTRHLLDFATACRARKLLLTSSGAIYGAQPSEITHLAEDYAGGPDPLNPASAYAEGKRISEQMCILYGRQSGMECKIARCFAFVGAHMPLHGAYAIGNFIDDVMNGSTISIKGDGTPTRSYLYAADLAIWLWILLFTAPANRAYNVGSDASISILDLAHKTATVLGKVPNIHLAGTPKPGAPVRRYVPNIERAQRELGLKVIIDLAEAICRTAKWFAPCESPDNQSGPPTTANIARRLPPI
jgi:dTDP-glucose 4,6-dehydratase